MRNLNGKWLATLFIMLAVFYLITLPSSPYAHQWLIKILPITLLIALAIRERNTLPKVFILGLVFSLCGDILLAIQQGKLFVFGLTAFLLAHICYILSFRPFDWQKLKSQTHYLIGYGVFATTVVTLLVPNLGDLLVPVLLYMLVLLLMALATLISVKSNLYLMLGGVSFVLSDSLIGLNKFFITLPHASLAIMITYYFAQYCLLMGMLKPPPQFDGVTSAASSS